MSDNPAPIAVATCEEVVSGPTKTIPTAFTPPRVLPMTLAEKYATNAILREMANQQAQLAALCDDRLKREGIDTKTVFEPRNGAWVEVR